MQRIITSILIIVLAITTIVTNMSIRDLQKGLRQASIELQKGRMADRLRFGLHEEKNAEHIKEYVDLKNAMTEVHRDDYTMDELMEINRRDR